MGKIYGCVAVTPFYPVWHHGPESIPISSDMQGIWCEMHHSDLFSLFWSCTDLTDSKGGLIILLPVLMEDWSSCFLFWWYSDGISSRKSKRNLFVFANFVLFLLRFYVFEIHCDCFKVWRILKNLISTSAADTTILIEERRAFFSRTCWIKTMIAQSGFTLSELRSYTTIIQDK